MGLVVPLLESNAEDQLLSRRLSPASLSKPERETSVVFRFEDLVFDVQAYIVDFFVPLQDLHSLTLVSRHLGSLATPALYSDVRLLFGLKPPVGSHRAEGTFTKTLLTAQRGFRTQVITQPEHARHVRSLAWQVCSSGSCGHTFTELFPLLENLTRIHLVDAHPTHMCELNHPPSALFPRVRDIRFTGTTSLSFALPLLHSPQHLTALSLDTVNPRSVDLQLLQWVSTADLSSLRVLSLRALSQQPWGDAQESDVLFAWRDALSAVRNTLEEVTLGFREQVAVSRDASLPSTVKFVEVVMPVFWEGKWPHLKKVQLEGIDIDGAGEVTSESAAQLRATVPEVIVDSTVRCVRRIWDSQATDKF